MLASSEATVGYVIHSIWTYDRLNR